MSFMSSIIQVCNDISQWFWWIANNCWNTGWPLSILGNLFYEISRLFAKLAWGFYDFSAWVTSAAAQLSQILNWNTIWNYILSNVPNLTQIGDWFYSWYANVTSTVTNWWSSTQYTVQAWVQGAKDQATALFNQVNSRLAGLQSYWDGFKGKIPSIDQLLSWWGNWWGNVLAQLNTWWNGRLVDIQALLNSAFLARESLWSGWQDMRANVIEFFNDPVGFIWHRFADWFLGPE